MQPASHLALVRLTSWQCQLGGWCPARQHKIICWQHCSVLGWSDHSDDHSVRDVMGL